MKEQTGDTIVPLKAHIAINVRNVEASIEFYRAMFGIEPCKVRTGYAKFDVRNPPLNFTLNEVPFNGAGALSHLGIQLGSSADVTATRDRWRAAGLDTRDEIGTNCCYAIQDKAWVVDPDGNEWEVFVVLEDDLTETTMCCLPASDGVAEPVAATTVAAKPEPVEGACCVPGSGCC